MQLNRSTKYSVNTNATKHSNDSPQSPNWNDSDFPSLQINNKQKFSDWFPQQSPNRNNPTNDDLHSSQKSLELTTELISKLKTCRIKMDQFKVVTKLAVKYITMINKLIHNLKILSLNIQSMQPKQPKYYEIID